LAKKVKRERPKFPEGPEKNVRRTKKKKRRDLKRAPCSREDGGRVGGKKTVTTLRRGGAPGKLNGTERPGKQDRSGNKNKKVEEERKRTESQKPTGAVMKKKTRTRSLKK